MTASALLAEKIRGVTKTGTDYAVAKALGISQSGLKQVLLGERNLGPESCVRAAELLGVPVSDVLAEVELSKAKTPEKKAFWEKRLPRLLPTLVIWGCSVGVTYFTPSVKAEGLTTVSPSIHYAQWLYTYTAVLARWFGRLELRLRRLRQTRYALGRFAPGMVYKEAF